MALAAAGLLSQSTQDKDLSLGPAIVHLASIVVGRQQLAAAARPSLQRLQRLTGETVSVHRKIGTQRVCLDEVSSTHEVKITSGVGHTYSLATGAASRAIMSLLRDEEVRRILGKVGARHEVAYIDRGGFLSGLQVVREKGYSITSGESILGASAIAVPLMTSDPDYPGALLVTGPAARLSVAKLESFAEELIEEARLIVDMTVLGAATEPKT